MTTDLILLNKQETMRLFTIRDRTFYSWIEKEILVQVDELDGQKRYDVTKALKLKNIDPADVSSLIAKQIDIVDSNEEPDSFKNQMPEKINIDQEIIVNLKSQVDTLKNQLADERDKTREVLSKMGMIEGQQKLLAEIRNNEIQQYELMQGRENNLMEIFQERMKELIIVTRENENQQYDRLLESVKQSQTERERSLKSVMKVSLGFIGVFFIFTVLVFGSMYFVQKSQIEQLNKDLDKQSIKATQALEKSGEEIKANAERLLAKDKIFEQEKRAQEESFQKRLESEKGSLVEFYNQNIKSLQTQVELVSKEKSSIKEDKDELRLQIQILETKFRNVLEEISNEKKNNSVTLKEQEWLKKSLIDINESLNKLREKATTPNATPITTPVTPSNE